MNFKEWNHKYVGTGQISDRRIASGKLVKSIFKSHHDSDLPITAAHPASSVAVMTSMFPGPRFHLLTTASWTDVDNADCYGFAAAIDGLLKCQV